MSVIPSSIAKEELVKINEFLTEPHVLIGGLAVQQYYPARNSSDIDLICDDQTAKGIIKKLYPTKDFEITETNEDDFRPAYVISSKVRAEKVIFIGPKITERDAYKFINWESLKKGSIAFSYQKKNLENIRVPQPELLAFTKLLSFLNRTASSRRKGENDLLDFINLSNGKSFSINALIDLIRSSSCEGFISTKLDELSGSYSVDIWNQSLFCDFLKLIKPALEGSTSVPAEVIFSDNYKKTYILEDSLEFYQEIAPLYDERNTEFLYDGHQSVIGFIISLLPSGGAVLDLGCGTGRLIASHFVHNDKFSWYAVDGSANMLAQFSHHTRKSQMLVEVLHADLIDLDWSVLPVVDLCMVCFTLSSMSTIDCFIDMANKVKVNGHFLIADIHPARTNHSPFYDFNISGGHKIALKPCPVYPDKLIERLLPKNFILRNQKTIYDGKGEEYAFISVLERIE